METCLKTNRALLLDRDGVINVDHGYVIRPEDFIFNEGVFDLVAEAKRKGYVVIVVTNQSGIGRGYYTEDDFWQLMAWVEQQFVAHGGGLDKIYFCPTHPVYGLGNYRQENEYRKPGPGMLLQAARDYNLDLAHSILVGDKASDIEAGIRAGVGQLVYFGAKTIPQPAVQVASLREVLALLNVPRETNQTPGSTPPAKNTVA